MRRRWWRRRKQLVVSYAMVALGASGLALGGTYVLLLTFARMAHRGW